MMSTCRWCTSVGDDVAKLLQRYCAGSLLAEDEEAVNEKKALNEDLGFCLECVVVYHRAKEELPGLHRRLWELETSRLLGHFSNAAKNAQPAKDLSYVEEDGREIGVPHINPAEYENYIRVPLSEVLKYPYLLAQPELSEMCVEAICKMEEYNSFQVLDKYPGIYLLLVHPNETVRRWAIGAARTLGKVDRDDFYELQDIFSCMFCNVELRIPQNFPDMDTSYDPTTKMTWLQPHLYDSKNDKNYWLGICMLLTQLDAQAMDSLFLGPDKQANILHCILNAMDCGMEDEEPSKEMDPFWPVLQCFMVILDCLGSKFWGPIEPTQAFQAITGRPSYSAELESIKQQTMISRVKTETTCDDDMVTCSQMVYDSNTKVSKEKGSRRSHGADSSVVYEEMSSLVNLLHSEMGQALRVHDSTFLWFIPFVKSVMDLDERSVIYINEVVHYLCGEISTDLLKRQVRICDKVTEFFTLILVHIIDLHLGSGRMNMLYYCAPKWVGVLVKCATLPGDAFVHTSEGSVSHSVSSTSSLRVSAPRKASTSRAVPQACTHIIRSLLKEGSRLNPNSKCKHFLNRLNKHLREGPQREWKLIRLEIQELQICLKDYVKTMMNRPTTSTPPPEQLNIDAGPVAPTTPPLQSSNDTSGSSGLAEFNHPIKQEGLWDYVDGSTSGGRDSNAVQRGRDIDLALLKKEPLTPEEEFVEPTNDSRPTQEKFSSLRADPEKIQVIKSRLGQLMTKKSHSERDEPSVGLSEFGKEKPQNLFTSHRDEASNYQGISRDPPCPQESVDNEQVDNVPLSVLKSNLKGRVGFKSSQDRSKGNSRQFDRQRSPPKPPSEVIVISDDEAILNVGRARGTGSFSETSQIKNEPDTSDQNHSTWRDYDGNMSESQVFEFETQEYMASAWSNRDSESNMPPEKPKEDSPVRHLLSPTLREPLSTWECDTQPIYDEDIERACKQVEKELEKPKTPPQGLKRAIVVKKRNLLVDAKPLASKCLSKKPTVVEKLIKEPVKDAPHAVTPPLRKSSSTVRSNRLETETPSSLTTSAISHKTSLTPAIVPPKKVRKAAEPVSIAEKLGLKKKERKAFNLSQQSHDTVDELRRHGATVDVPQAKKPTRKTKRSKVTSPHKRVVNGSNKKLLASQEFQFFRQSKQASGAGTSAKAEPMKRNPKKIDEIQRPSFVTEADDEDEDLRCSQLDPARHEEQLTFNRSSQRANENKPASSNTVSSVSSNMDRQISPYFQRNDDVTPGPSGQVSKSNEEGDGYDADWMYLTQMEPTDMEMCSQMEEEEEEEEFFYTQRDPVDMDIDSDSQMPFDEKGGSSDWTWPKQADEGQEAPLATQTFKKPATPPPSRSNLAKDDDRLFLKPGMSPMSVKKAKPSTTKIYATSSSRSASLVQEMERTANASFSASSAPAGRGRPARPVVPGRPVVPARSPCVLQPPPHPEVGQSLQLNRLLYRPITPQLPPKPIPPKQPLPRPEQILPRPPGQPLRPIQHSNIGSTPQPSTSKTYPRPDAPFQRQIPNPEVCVRFDPNYLIQHILKWTFDMFSNYKQFGIPSEVCELPLETVGFSFSSYDKYYKTFYPLLLTNTFEELAGEWLKNKESGKVVTQNLKVVANEYSNSVWNVSFTASITASDVSRQMYPREDDLVILWLPQNTGAYSRHEQGFLDPQEHFGYVQRSNICNGGVGQCPTLNLMIKTLGNVTMANKQAVRCDVVDSLVSTMRVFRAICQLNGSSMLKPILAPQVSYFQPGPEVIPSLNLPGYNPDQVRAVRTGMSVIRNQQLTPKICLIHGPPGTGKSKTIVGLLQTLFSEGVQSMAPPVNRQAKPRRTRVLLCAPSNAAIDNLMKKIILVFKEKCKNIQGNCGDINLVRLGNDRTISKNLKPFSLDSQVKNKTQKALMSQDSDVHRRIAQLDENIDKISKMLPKLQKNEEMYHELAEQKSRLLQERKTLGYQLKQSRSRKQETQARVLQDAHVVCCTLSSSGSTVLESAFRRLGHKPFSCVIVDEAGQATETETLIPMLYQCNALILVGDPHQLPPTVISQTAKELKYGQSLMARLVTNLDHYCKENKMPSPVVFLSYQYRMHPDICEFPSKHIYRKALKTDDDTAARMVNFGWPFQPYRVFDVTDGQEVKEGESFSNLKEVQLVVILLRMMAEKQQVKVGVITPYKAQKDRINRELAKMVNKNLTVDVDTVEGFQGREMDCIIVSCVRASHEQGGIGFLGNRQRLNVTITRAKFSLFILGHLRTLQENQDWGALIKDAATRDVIKSTNEMTFKTVSRKIFKQELTRSLSNPLREPGPPPAASRAAPIGLRRSSEPALFAQGWDSPKQPSSASPPQAADRPTDPRLVVQHPQAPQHRADWDLRAEGIRDPRAEMRRDPRAEMRRDPRAEIRRDPRAEIRRDPRAEIRRDPRAEIRRDPRAEIRRDPRAEGYRDSRVENLRDPRAERDPRVRNSPEQLHPTVYQNLRCAGRERDMDRERHHSPVTAPCPGD
ncbi:probable helicase senataxin isoform X1 [Coregonus clupeaformis]|uniref:probable helicase senataxin isoform X1 n=2 Tax=Coregonus clupeaformis TaxID=59861 RepID=UPI001E1C58C6|nr:probable helicase senataxin isoform X1 [Coregonus clupeaformis]